MHRERRKFLRSALKELATVLADQPGLLGPKVTIGTPQHDSISLAFKENHTILCVRVNNLIIGYNTYVYIFRNKWHSLIKSDLRRYFMKYHFRAIILYK